MLSDYLKKEELARLHSAWQHFTPWQKKYVVLRAFIITLPRRLLEALNQHIQTRRSRFAYFYQAHWVGV